MNLRSVRIGARLGIGFASVLALLAFVVIGGNVAGERSMERLRLGLESATAKGTLAEKMKTALFEATVATRNMGLQAEVAGIQREEAKVKEQRKLYAQAREQLTALGLSDAEKEILANIARIDQEMEKPFFEVIGLLVSFDVESAAKIISGRIDPISRQALVAISKLVDIEQAAAQNVLDRTAESARQFYMLIYALGGIAFALGVGCAIVITRSITRPLRDAVAIASRVAEGDLSSDIAASGKDETADLMRALKEMAGSLNMIVAQVRGGTEAIGNGTKEIAKGNADLSQRTEQQASSLEETASSMEELTSTVKQNAENAKQANQLAIGASSVAVKGGEVVSEVVDTMFSINESSKKIVDIIGVIDGIAFQTNILALNAAVEAARAGEQGRGFAVVASEVRSLAQRSAAAAKEIKELIGDSVDKVGAGTKLVDEAGRTMQEIVTAVKRVTDIMSEITAASQEQSSGIEQVNQAIAQMDEVTQQNAALVEEAAAAAESLKEQAQNLDAAVAVFKLGNVCSEVGIDRSVKVVEKLGKTARSTLERQGPNRALNIARLPGKSAKVQPAVQRARAVVGGEKQWEEF